MALMFLSVILGLNFPMQISFSIVAIQFDLFLIDEELLWTVVVWACNMKKMVT